MNETYRKTRRAYLFSSVILLSWNLIGVTIKSGSIQFKRINIYVDSPEVIPLLLMAIVVYFLIRFTLEWNQIKSKVPKPEEPEVFYDNNDSREDLMIRRSSEVSDFVLTHFIGLFSLMFFASSLIYSSQEMTVTGKVLQGILLFLVVFFTNIILLRMTNSLETLKKYIYRKFNN